MMWDEFVQHRDSKHRLVTASRKMTFLNNQRITLGFAHIQKGVQINVVEVYGGINSRLQQQHGDTSGVSICPYQEAHIHIRTQMCTDTHTESMSISTSQLLSLECYFFWPENGKSILLLGTYKPRIDIIEGGKGQFSQWTTQQVLNQNQ